MTIEANCLVIASKKRYTNWMRYILLITLFTFALTAETIAGEREVFFGTWGTLKQCSRAPIKPEGTVLSEPFEISSHWLRHGNLWCSLNWGPVEARKNGFFTAAHAQCGEDSVRAYFLGLELSGSNLRLRWSFPQLSGLLARCPGS